MALYNLTVLLDGTSVHEGHAVVTCEIKLFQNHFSFRRRPSEIILFQRMEIYLKLFQNYFRGLLQLMIFFNLYNVEEIVLT